MSATVDERIVAMRFDNKQFESNVQTSLSTIDKLKQSLQFDKVSKSFEGISAAAGRVNLSGLGGAVETVQVKFSALQTMAVTALANITNSAVNTGKRLVSALTVDPIKTGFSEYETQINAVQTILANTSSKGTTLDQVNNALDELNTYADKTIYNFTEMTKNIGTFTAAGVDLDTSVSAIQGIANLAAISGSSSHQASTAMYQLSQALASGQVTLQDWNSVVNAGMGGQIFQDALKRTAKLMGKNIDESQSFRESISTQGGTGWLTSEVLLATLEQFTMSAKEGSKEWNEFKKSLKEQGYTEKQAVEILKMANTATDAATKVKTFTQLWDTLKESVQSGWTQSWEIVVGDFEEAKTLLTEISDTFGAIIGESAEARNTMLQGWKDLGGRALLIDGLRNSFEGIMSVIEPISQAFEDIFPPITAKQLYDFTEKFKEFTSKLTLGEEQSKNLKSTFKGLFAILDIGKKALTAVWNAISPIVGGAGTLANEILKVTATWGEWLVGLNESIESSDIFNKTLRGIVNVIKTGVNVASGIVMGLVRGVQALADAIKAKIGAPGLEAFHEFLEKFNNRVTQISDGVQNAFLGISTSANLTFLTQGLDGFLNGIYAVWEGVKTIGSGIVKVCGIIGSALSDAFNNANFDQTFDLINGGLITGILLSIKKFVGGFKDVGGIVEQVTDILDSVRGCFEAYQQNLKAKTLITIAGAIAILAASVVAISMVDSEKLTNSLLAITALFADLLASMSLFSKMSGLGGVTKSIGAMVGIAVSIAILASVLTTVASIDSDGLQTGLLGIIALTGTLVAASKILSSGTGKVAKGTTSLVIFAAAIKVLASACKDLSVLSWEELGKGLVGVGALMGEVAIFLNAAKFGGKTTSTAVGMVVLGAAIKILASACADFSSMSWEEVGKGLTAIGVLLGEVALFTNLTGNASKVVSTGAAMVLLGAAMKIFASAIKDFASMSWSELAVGLVGMASALAEITIALNFMPKNMIGTGVGLIAVSAAITILADALGKMGGMSWEEVGKGLAALGGSMAILAIGLNFMNGTLAGSAALIVAAGALAILTPTLTVLGSMSWEAIAKGLVSLAGAFAVIGVAGLVLAPIMPSILSLGGAFALIGVGIAGVGVGLMAAGAGIAAIAAGLLSLVTISTTGAAAIVGALTVIIVGIADLIPAVLTKIGEGIVALCGVLVASAPAICEAVTVIIVSVVAALVASVPVLVDGIFVLLTSILVTLADYTPTIVQAALDVLIALLKGIADNIGMVIKTAIDVVLAFLIGIAEKIPDVIQAGFDILLCLINGITDAINKNTPLLVEAINKLFLALVDAAITVLTGGVNLFKQVGEKIMNTGLVKGIRNAFKSAKNAVKELIDNAKKAISDKVKEWTTAGKDLISGFIEGIKNKASSVVESAKGVVNDALEGAKKLLGIHSPSREFAALGEYSDEGFIQGLMSNIGGVKKAGGDVGKGAIAGVTEAIGEMPDVAVGVTPTLNPQVDTTTAKSEYDEVKSWLDEQKYYNKITLEEELAAWQDIQKKYAEGTEERKQIDREVYRVQKEINKKTYDDAVSLIDERKYYNQLSLEEELAAWQDIQKKYAEGTEERKQIDREVYRVQNEIHKKAYDDAIALIDDKKYYNQMSLIAELAAWKRIQKKYAEGTEERKKADREVYRLQKEINKASEDYYKEVERVHEETTEKKIELEEEYYEKTNEINKKLKDDIQSVNDKYDDAVESRTKSLYNAYGLFDKVETPKAMDGDVLLDNLRNQVIAFGEWKNNIDSLETKGIDQNLLTELREMGPSAAAEIAGLNNMSAGELEAFVTLWRQKYNMAQDAATHELENLRKETAAEIEALKQESSEQLTDYKDEWNTRMSEIVTDSEQRLTELRTNWQENLGLLRGDAESEFTIMMENVTNILGNMTNWSEQGANIIEGVIVGINENSSSLIGSIQAVMASALAAAKASLGIASPSKEFAKLGMYADQGFALGLSSFTNVVNDASANIGKDSITALSDTLSRIWDAVDSDMDMTPTIRPVVDLTDFNKGCRYITTASGRLGMFSVSGSVDRAYEAVSYRQLTNNRDNQVSSNQNAASISFTQNNYSPKALSRIDIYRQTKNQFSAMERKIKA